MARREAEGRQVRQGSRKVPIGREMGNRDVSGSNRKLVVERERSATSRMCVATALAIDIDRCQERGIDSRHTRRSRSLTPLRQRQF